MKKAKPKSKVSPKKSAKKSSPRTKKAVDPAEVRKNITNMVGADAKKITKAVVDEALKGQLATVKYLFEVAGVYPATAEESPTKPEQDTLARTLLHRMGLPVEPLVSPEDELPVNLSGSGSGNAAAKDGEGAAEPRENEVASSAVSEEEEDEVPVPVETIP